MIMLSVESPYVTDVFERLNKIPYSASFRYYNSAYNLGAICQLKSLSDLEGIKELINKQCTINEIKTCLWTDVRNIPGKTFWQVYSNIKLRKPMENVLKQV